LTLLDGSLPVLAISAIQAGYSETRTSALQLDKEPAAPEAILSAQK
jgi:hypothetical protein